MVENQYYTDVKYTTWVRTVFNIKADTDKGANKIAKEILYEKINPEECDDVDILTTEELDDQEYAGEKELYKVNKFEDELIEKV